MCRCIPYRSHFLRRRIPYGQEIFLDLNAKLAQEWPIISEVKRLVKSNMKHAPTPYLISDLTWRELRLTSLIKEPMSFIDFSFDKLERIKNAVNI